MFSRSIVIDEEQIEILISNNPRNRRDSASYELCKAFENSWIPHDLKEKIN